MTRFRHEGAPVFVESSAGPPLVDFVVQLRGGAIEDPAGQEGATRVMARLLRRGWRGVTPTQVDESLDRLGARLSITLGHHSVRVQVAVLARNFGPAVELVARLVREPALRETDLRRAKRRIRAALHSLLDDDRGLADRHLRAHLYAGHPLGHPVGGTRASVARIDRGILRARHRALFVAERLQFGAAGQVGAARVQAALGRHFGELPRADTSAVEHVAAATAPRHRRVRVVDKPGRQQTQLGMALLAPGQVGRGSRGRHALMVADAIFGGMFTSRLSSEIRTRLGFSYSTYSQLHAGPSGGSWEMWSHPSTEHAHACAARQIELLEAWHGEGLTVREVARAKRWLIRGRCFEEDTAAHRLDLQLAAALRASPKRALRTRDDFRARIDAVDAAWTRRALRSLDPKALAIVAVGDAKALVPELEALPGVGEVEVVPPDGI